MADEDRTTQAPDEGQAEASEPVPAPAGDGSEQVGSFDVSDLLDEGIRQTLREQREVEPEAEVTAPEDREEEPEESEEPEEPEDEVEPPAAEDDDEPPEDEDFDEDEDEDADAEDGDDEPDESREAQRPDRPYTEAEWKALLDEGKYAEAFLLDPRRVSEIPSRQRQQAIASAHQELQKDAFRKGAEAMFLRMQEHMQREGELRSLVAEKDGLAEYDRDAFLDWQREHPDEAARYFQAKRYFDTQGTENPEPMPEAAAPPQQQPAPGQDIQAEAEAELQRLSELPEDIRQPVVQRVMAREFPLTPRGLIDLTRAIDEAAAKARTPDERTERRREAAKRRRKTARPDVGRGGTNGNKANPLAEVDDVDELLNMGVSGERPVATR